MKIYNLIKVYEDEVEGIFMDVENYDSEEKAKNNLRKYYEEDLKLEEGDILSGYYFDEEYLSYKIVKIEDESECIFECRIVEKDLE